MPSLVCTVEMHSSRAGGVIRGEFAGASVFEAAWMALCAWCRNWYYDPDAVITVRQGERAWRVSQQRIKNWRPLVSRERADAQAALFDKSPEAL
jgi:hypothetical protein